MCPMKYQLINLLERERWHGLMTLCPKAGSPWMHGPLHALLMLVQRQEHNLVDKSKVKFGILLYSYQSPNPAFNVCLGQHKRNQGMEGKKILFFTFMFKASF